MTETVNTQH